MLLAFSQEILLRVAIEAKLVGQLIKRVGLHNEAGLDQAFHLFGHVVELAGVGIVVAALVIGQRRAADGMEALHVDLPVAVPHLVPVAFAFGVFRHGAQHEVVRRALVVETLAVHVDAQERLRAEEVVAVVFAADAIGVARFLLGGQQAAVERQRAGNRVHRGARPQQRLDAVARAVRECVERAQCGVALGLQGLVHVFVVGIAAGAHDDALGRVHADVFAVAVFRVQAFARAVLDNQALHRRAEANLAVAEALDIGIHDVGHIAFAAGVFAVGAMAGGPLVVARAGRHVPLELHFHAVFGKQVAIPVDGLARVFGPFAPQLRVDLPNGVVIDVVDDVHHIDGGLIAFGLLQFGIHRAKRRAAHARTRSRFLDEQRFRAVLGGACRGEIACRACAHDNDVEIERLDAIGIGDLRRLAQPVGAAAGGLRAAFGCFLAARLLRRAAARHACDGGQAHGGGRARQKRATIHFCFHNASLPVCAMRRVVRDQGWAKREGGGARALVF